MSWCERCGRENCGPYTWDGSRYVCLECAPQEPLCYRCKQPAPDGRWLAGRWLHHDCDYIW